MNKKPSVGNIVISKLITLIKKREYNIDNSITGIDLLSIVIERFFMVVRGLKGKILFKESQGLIFMGEKVKIQSYRNVKLGKNASIGNYCHINAFM